MSRFKVRTIMKVTIIVVLLIYENWASYDII